MSSESAPLLGNQKGPSVNDVYTSFTTGSVEAGFIKKVYGMLTLQLLLTTGTCMLFMYEESCRQWILSEEGQSAFIAVYILTIIVLVSLLCFHRKYPLNVIMLVLFTAGESVTMGFICATYAEAGQGFVVAEAFVLTSVIFISLTAYALVTRKNFEYMFGFLFTCIVLMIVWLFIQWFFPMGPIGRQIFALLGSLVFCGFILVDTSRLMHIYGPDDYIIATINLYLDFINLFLYLLQLLGSSKR